MRVRIKTWDEICALGAVHGGTVLLRHEVIWSGRLERQIPADRIVDVTVVIGSNWVNCEELDWSMPSDLIAETIEEEPAAFACTNFESDPPIIKASPFTDDSELRKGYPVYSGFMAYFPDAMAAVCKLSKEGNDKHNAGEPLHWSRDKSSDHKDCIGRHLIDGDWVELAWRAMANLQVELENGYKEDRS